MNRGLHVPPSNVDVIPVYELVAGYTIGRFPMGLSGHETEIHWVKPETRAIFPLLDFHVPRRLKRYIRQASFHASLNSEFSQVIRHCGNRRENWINQKIIRSYEALHEIKLAHSIEIYHSNQLVGGLYGVSIGGAFFGESMYSKRSMASQVALIHLIGHLRATGYQLLDTQFITPHLQRFGAILIPEAQFQDLLCEALRQPCRLDSQPFESNSINAIDRIEQKPR